MKIALIGADGQLGVDLQKVIPEQEIVSLTISNIDITKPDQVHSVLAKIKPELVINTAAYHEVDKCEDDPAPAFAVNADGAKNLAAVCRDQGAALVHISTDYVFDGEKKSPYVETDRPNPLSVYGRSKLAGENFIREILPAHFIIRTTGLYGAAGCLGKGGTNFVEGMIARAASQPELRVVIDEIICPTYTLDLAESIAKLVKTKHYGLYHIVNPPGCSWYEFTCEIFRLLGRKVVVKKALSADFGARARRPKYSVLQNAALQKLGLDQMRLWPEALKAYLTEKNFL